MKYQGLRQVFEVTEWKDDCVFKTKQLGYAWVTLDHESEYRNIQYHSISTDLMKELNHRVMRKVSDEYPDYIPVSLADLKKGK